MERWPTLQAGAGQDRAIGTMVFMLNIARGAGLPHPSFDVGSQCSPYPPTYSAEQFNLIKTRLTVSILYASLDPPSDLAVIGRGINQLTAPWRTRG